MKQIIFMRHAKTEERSLMGADFERNLKERGKEDAKKISLFLQKRAYLPEIILCSPANRTRQTCDLFLKTTHYKGEVKYLENLYHSEASGILEMIKEYSDEHQSIMMIGHNMGISQLANVLCKEGCEELPTAGIVVIEFDSTIELYTGVLKLYMTPKAI